MSLLLAAVFLLGSVGSAPLQGQEPPPPLEVELEPEEGRVRIRLNDVLGDPSLQDALHSGLPLRVEIVTQLWDDGFFDSQQGQARWGASVVYDPLGQQYVLTVREESGTELRFRTLSGLRDALPRTLAPALRPAEEGRYYYLSRIEVETLSLSDLEELRRWLRGDLADAIAGETDVEGAMERGLRRTVVRLLGIPARRYETRTPTFEFETAPGE